jgi:hypothetical protein
VQEALNLVAHHEPARRVEVIALSAGIARLRGRHRQASAQLASALDELGGRPSPERSALEIELAAEPGYTRTVSAASARGERALLTAEPLGDPAQVHLREKTVETHLARALAKLGVRRRAALASRIAERS